jgi:predicted amidohydrolase YtcJ
MALLMPCRRRDLLRFVTAVPAAFSASTEPDLVLHNGVCTPWTPRNRRLRRWPGARFLAAASNPDILRLATVRTRKMDLGGETVVPGFVDPTPIRPPPVLRHLREVDCDLRSIAAIVEAIRQRAAAPR